MARKTIGELKLRDRHTKQRIGVVRVSTLRPNVIEIDCSNMEPDLIWEMPPDIAIALADLLMEAAAPKNHSDTEAP